MSKHWVKMVYVIFVGLICVMVSIWFMPLTRIIKTIHDLTVNLLIIAVNIFDVWPVAENFVQWIFSVWYLYYQAGMKYIIRGKSFESRENKSHVKINRFISIWERFNHDIWRFIYTDFKLFYDDNILQRHHTKKQVHII